MQKYNISEMIIKNWGKEEWARLNLHYKTYIRNNYKNTLIRRLKKAGK